MVSAKLTYLPAEPVKTSATWKGCDKKRWILRARATASLSSQGPARKAWRPHHSAITGDVAGADGGKGGAAEEDEQERKAGDDGDDDNDDDDDKKQ